MLGFKPKKTIQAAAYLLKKEPGGRMNYMRLLKLLYLADRQSIKERKEPICGGQVYAMNEGPVISPVLDMIKGRDPESDSWDRAIERCGFDVALRGDHPGVLELSRAEMRILDQVAEEHENRNEWELVHWCHVNLPEYQKNEPEKSGLQRKLISLDDVLEAIGALASKAEILAQANADVYFSKLFGDHSSAHG
jgi:uncharacterized phage-associated protein